MDKSRYIRQTLLSRIGESGQEKLLDSCIAIVGCGGLGSLAAPYLAGSGVGHLILIDGDIPDLTNLHRQVFFNEKETKRTKSTLLAEHIGKLNSGVKITIINEMISKSNISELLESADIVLECTDNIQAKYLVNDYCHINSIPVVYGAIYKYDGYVSLFENLNTTSIHLRDIFPIPDEATPTCSEVGVIGTIAGLIGILQANEAIKYITKAGDTLVGKLLSYDILTNNQMKLKLKKTWNKNLSDVFESSDYNMVGVCETNEIGLNEIIENREKYILISILEDNEHKYIDKEVIRTPLNAFKIEEWIPVSNKIHVFYCLTGKRSKILVNKLEANGIDQVYSLRGGLKSNMY